MRAWSTSPSGLWSADGIERALAHEEAKSARRAYARGERWDERVRMAAWWFERCDQLRFWAKIAVRFRLLALYPLSGPTHSIACTLSKFMA